MERALDTLVTPVVVGDPRPWCSGSGYVHLDATPLALCIDAGAARDDAVGLGLDVSRAESRSGALPTAWCGSVPVDEIACRTHPGAVLRQEPLSRMDVVQTDGASRPRCAPHRRRQIRHPRLLGAREAVCRGRRRDPATLGRRPRAARGRDRSCCFGSTPARGGPERRGGWTRPGSATWRTRFSVPLVEALFTQAATDVVALPPNTARDRAGVSAEPAGIAGALCDDAGRVPR